MADLGGFKQASTLDLLQTIGELHSSESEDSGERAKDRQIRARAFAQACAIHGCKMDELTPTMHSYAEAIERRMRGGGTEGKGYGFSISTEGRKPNVR